LLGEDVSNGLNLSRRQGTQAAHIACIAVDGALDLGSGPADLGRGGKRAVTAGTAWA